MKQFSHDIKHTTDILQDPIRQATVERSNHALNEMLLKWKGQTIKSSKVRLNNAVLTLKVLNANETGTTATEQHWIVEKQGCLNSEWKAEKAWWWGRRNAFVSTRGKKSMDSIKTNWNLTWAKEKPWLLMWIAWL